MRRKRRNTIRAAIKQIVTGQSKLTGSEPATASVPSPQKDANTRPRISPDLHAHSGSFTSV